MRNPRPHATRESPVPVGQPHEDEQIPLFVDLDGTLVKSDLLLEGLLSFAKSHVLALPQALAWLLRGKARLKSQIAQRVEIDPSTLPYHAAFLEFLRGEAARGRALYLATASNEKLAYAVARHLGIFRGVIASTDTVNLKGASKLEDIKTIARGLPFAYAGNDRADLEVLGHARQGILVNPQWGVEPAARTMTHVARIFDDRQDRLQSWLSAFRVHQWLKNGLVFVPLLTAHAWHLPALTNAVIAFAAFSLVASATYMVNDLLDLQSDRRHPRKRVRPFAAGAISQNLGVALAFATLFAGFAVSLLLPAQFQIALLGYLAITLLYSLHLKAYVLVDVIVLACLYTLRLIAGAAAIGVALSFWLLAFAAFLFLSLALIKRCSELVTMAQSNRIGTSGRDYQVSDLAYLSAMGTAAGYAAIVVLALFINSPDVTVRYSEPRVLWLLCPLFLYWISRLWLKTGRGEMDDDPIVFTLRDRNSRYVIGTAVVVLVLAKVIF